MSTTSGLLVVDKPGGWTSHQVVGRVRRLAGTRKVGHAGTLDPMATGVLVVGVNRATRLLGHLARHDKRYLATIRLGQATVTDDAEGEVVDSPGAAGISLGQVEPVLGRLTGEISQVPSAVSAIKVDGRRSYARVRAGEQVELAARQVSVTRFEVLTSRSATVGGVEVLDLDVDVECSSGTYVRALARDLGRLLGSAGHLTALRRTRVGPFTLDQPHLGPSLAELPKQAWLSMAAAARLCFPVVEVTADQARELANGRPLPYPVSELSAAVGPGEVLLGLYGPDGGRPVAVLQNPGEDR
ncbi:MAG: tRNA pseudouridine(55) synthase TruB [Actinomycetia bacterium]|nr:tRNA pseudouridine(55) synthase TruB [Actinomycetes bacterium]